VKESIVCLAKDQAARAAMSTKGQQLVDGQGALRVAQAILAGVRASSVSNSRIVAT